MNPKHSLLTVVFVLSFISCFSTRVCKNAIDGSIDTIKSIVISPTVYNKDESDARLIIDLLDRYWNARDSTITFYRDWTSASTEKYIVPDYMLRSSLSYYNNREIVPNLIFLEKGSAFWKAKMAFAVFNKGSFEGVVCEYNFGVKKENGDYKLFNLFDEAQLSKINEGGIEFYVDAESNSNREDIQKTIAFNEKMNSFFNGKLNFKYVNVKSNVKLNKLLGFDFEQYMYIPTPASAFSDVTNKIIYASNNSFFYPHEVVHLYVHEFYANTCHSWVDEGLATYWGGSMGFKLEEHLKRMNVYLSAHPEINLSNLLDYIRMDEVTSYKYCIGGLICKLVDEKEGKEGLTKLLRCGKKDEDYYKFITGYFDITKEGLNKFIREEIIKYK